MVARSREVLATTPGSGPKTARGRATRSRIVAAAALLMYERGVAGTSLDDVREATSTSKSQLYHYFADKSALVCAVVSYQQEAVLAGQQPFLGEFATLKELKAWRDRIVKLNGAAATFCGCPIGGLASEVADTDDDARGAASAAFDAWRGQLAEGLGRMRATGELPKRADPDELALGVLAALQGGLLLAQTTKQIRPLEVALDHAIAGIEARVVPKKEPRAK